MIREFTDINLSKIRQERNVIEEYDDGKRDIMLREERRKLEERKYFEDKRERWKEVFKDWRDQFPFLKPFGSMRLMYRTDIFLIGLLIEKSQYGGSYDVCFEVKPLWLKFTDNFDYCFQNPVLEDPGRSRSMYHIRFNYNMREDSHHRDFMPAVKSTLEQFGKVLEGRAESGFLMEEMEKAYVEDTRFKGWEESQYHEFKLALALYFNDREMWDKAYQGVEESLRKKEEAVQSWNTPRNRWGSILNRWQKRRKKNRWDYLGAIKSLRRCRVWKRDIDELLTDRDKFMALCEENSKLRKIRSLNKGELIYTPYHEPVRLKKRR